MDRFKTFTLPICILAWVMTTLAFVQYQRDSYSELRRLCLDTQINYAIDAAVDVMVEDSKDLQLDYGDWEYLSCDPEVALDEFCSMYLESQGLIDTPENRAWVTATYCKAFVVATYDGYYVGSPTTINANWARDIVFSIKQPYFYKDGSDYYALNMTRQSCKRLRNGVLETVERPSSIQEQDVKTIINGQISDAFTKAVGEAMQWHNTETIYVPSDYTDIVGTNAIEQTSALVYMSGLPAGFGRTTDSFAIGGARVQHERFVGCYLKDGVKMYQYVDKLDDTYDIIETFETPIQAAEAGYEFDIALELGK